jgi:hypothetical protein
LALTMLRPLRALCLIVVCAGIAPPREMVTSRPEARTAPRQVTAAPRPASAVVRKLTSLEQHAEERERSREEGAPLMLVKYYSANCRACHAIAPRYRSLVNSLGSSVRAFEMEQKAFNGLSNGLGVRKLPCVQVYAGDKVEDLLAGPSNFKDVSNKIANDLYCDPRSELPCELTYDDELGPIPDFAELPVGYSTDYYSRLNKDQTAAEVRRPPPPPAWRRSGRKRRWLGLQLGRVKEIGKFVLSID